jgi:hypothetical protein
LIALAIAVGCLVAVVVLTVRSGRPAPDATETSEMSWPEPETRPRF